MEKKYEFYFDAKRCIKCWACEVACRQWKGIPTNTIKLRTVSENVTGKFPDVKREFMSATCRHCSDAPCAAACPEQAITQRQQDGIVVVDVEKCNGCRICFDACPYGIPRFDLDGKMHKCDMCLDRIEAGQEPICVATCPTMALRWQLAKTAG